jgi:hypothetical protein
MREKISAYIIFVKKPEGKRPLGRLKSRGENIIKKKKLNVMGRCGLNSCG